MLRRVRLVEVVQLHGWRLHTNSARFRGGADLYAWHDGNKLRCRRWPRHDATGSCLRRVSGYRRGEAIITLDDARAEFARFLADDPKARWRIDAALAHVVRWAYMRGRDDAVRDELNELARDAGLKEE